MSQKFKSSIEIDGSVTATSIVKSGGTASQFLKANGSVDSTSYLSLAGGTITGALLVNGKTTLRQLQIDRNQTNAAIWFQEGNLDTNHVLWNDYYGGPTTKGAAGSGFDGIKWNTNRGIHIKGGSAGAYNIIVAENSSGSTNDHYIRLYASNVERLRTTTSGVTITGTASATTFSGALSGNATTATTLQTARTINGTSFNGSANITTANWGTARNLTIGSSAKSVDGSANVSFSHSEMEVEYQVPNGTLRNNLGSPTIREAALFHGQFNNKFRFLAPTLQEESTNGTTWVASTRASANALRDLMIGEGQGTSITAIPSATVGVYGGYRLTWDVTGSTGYVFLNALYIYNSTSGNTVTITIEAYHNTNGWGILAGPKTTSNWPGHAYFPHNSLPYSTNTSQYGQVRITFSTTHNVNTNGFTLYAIEWFGGYPQGRRNVEYYDRDKNVTFPAAITGSRFVSTIASGTAPMTITSTTRVANLNVATAGTADILTTARSINGVSFNGSANIVVEPYVEDDESTNADRFLTFVDNSTAGHKRLNEDSSLKYNPSTNTLTTTTFAGSLSGNASTATSAATWTTARTLTIGNTGKSVNGSANVSWSLAEIGALPAAGGTLTGTLVVADGASIAYADSAGTYIPRPAGGYYKTSTDAHTGAIKIKLPGSIPADMMSFWVDIYDYAGTDAGESVSLYIYGYAYSTTSPYWTNVGALVLSDRTDMDYTVRFGWDGTNHCVTIGETTSTWSHPQVNVRDFQAGYDAAYTTFDNNFAVSFVTTLPTIGRTASANYVAAKTAQTLQTARTINGVSFNGSANITITANTPQTLTRGTYLTGNNFNGSAATTWAVDATSANTASKVVARDASGNFSAGTITAALSGNASTATSAATLTTARTINGTSFNGSANITTANWGTARNLTIGSTAKSVNGSGNVSWTLAEIGALGATAKAADSNLLDGIDSSGFARVYKGTANFSNAAFVNAFNVSGDALASAVRFSVQGTANNVVINVVADLFVNHSGDILITTYSGFYTTLSIRVQSNGNEAYSVLLSSNSANAATCNIEVFPLNSESVTFGGTATTGSTLNHTAYYGTSTSGSGGNAGDVRTAGSFIGSLNGNANTATTLQTARTFTIGSTGKSFNGSANLAWTLAEIGVPSTTGFGASGSWGISVTGNSATATTLQTARTINGTSFNGSANITTANWGTARTINGLSINGSTNYAIGRIYDTNYRRFTNPGGGEYVTQSSSVTGAIEIVFPNTFNSGMYKLTIQVFEYTEGESFTVYAAGHTSGTDWYNTTAYIVGSPSIDRRFTIRFGRNAANKAVIYIGEINSVWSYPQVFLTEFQCGFSGYQDNSTGWAINFRTAAFEDVNKTISNCQVGYALSTNTANTSVLRDGSGNFSAGTITAALSGNATTATTLQTARTFTIGSTGKSFNGSGNLAWTLAEIGVPSTTGYGASGSWGINVTGSAASLTTARTFTIGSTGKTFNGTANLSWTLAEIGVPSTTGYGASGTWGIGFNTSNSSQIVGSYTGSYTTDSSPQALLLSNTSGSTAAQVLKIRTSSSTSMVAINFWYLTNQRGYINVTQYGTTYNTTSDYRAKENIVDLENASERIMKLKPRRFSFKDTDNKMFDGFLAHEAQEVVPEAVNGEKDAVNEDGTPAYQAIDQSKLIPLLTAALQDALKRIDQLEKLIQTK